MARPGEERRIYEPRAARGCCPPTALDQRGSGERIPPRSLREGPALPDALAFWLLIARRSCCFQPPSLGSSRFAAALGN